MYDINSFTFFASYYDALKTMKKSEKERFLLAILEFMFDGIEPDFKGNMATYWILIHPNLIKSKNKSNRNQT